MRIKDLMRNDRRKGGESKKQREGIGKSVEPARMSANSVGLGRGCMLQQLSVVSRCSGKGDQIREVAVSTPRLISKPSAD